jgi:N-acetyl-anhydromuramyl-L-alanine amidase AmpD
VIAVVQKPVADGNWRRGPEPPRPVRAIVLHVAEGKAASVDSWFHNPEAKVSAHFLVGLDGSIRQYVGIHDVAYHAGEVVAPTWAGYVKGENPNAVTVGIEHEGYGLLAWPEPQLTASALLSAWLVYRFELPVDALHFPLHREIKATKTCPGPAFDRDQYLARVRAMRLLFGADVRQIVTGIR